MIPALSQNAQAILMLTAPLIAGRGSSSPDLLSPGEYKRLARRLRELQRQPADLTDPSSTDLLSECQTAVAEDRLRRLLERGFLLSQVVERWQSRAIWVVSRADPQYPRRLKARLREDAPPVLYGCGDINLLETGGLAVVGSRHVDDVLIEYTMDIGRLAARAGQTLVSGGARGIDQAAMRGALEGGGKVSGVLGDSLEKTAMNREHRNLIMDGQLTLISPYDPSAGFNVGNAMQRNKLIYALADAALVVSSDVNKGGTWTGAVEQLEKYRQVTVYVRSRGEPSKGLEALKAKGAMPWPEPVDVEGLETIFALAANETVEPRSDMPLFAHERDAMDEGTSAASHGFLIEPVPAYVIPELTPESPEPNIEQKAEQDAPQEPQVTSPAHALFNVVREIIRDLLRTPLKDSEVAQALNVSTTQAKLWLQQLVSEGVLEKQKKPAGYVVKQNRLFD